LFNFNNFNIRLPAISQHHIKYFNPQTAHPCVIPRILSHHASKSVKGFDLWTCLWKKVTRKWHFTYHCPEVGFNGFLPNLEQTFPSWT